MMGPSASSRCPLPVNSANKSVSVEGRAITWPINQPEPWTREETDRGLSRDRWLDLNKLTKEEQKIWVIQVSDQWQEISPEKERERAGSRQFEWSLFSLLTIGKMPLSKAFNLQMFSSKGLWCFNTRAPRCNCEEMAGCGVLFCWKHFCPACTAR